MYSYPIFLLGFITNRKEYHMQKAIEIQRKNLTLRGMLHTPDQITGKLPTIIMFHGFGGNKMGPHFLFVKFSRILTDLGIASIRFDFAGSGESDGEFIEMTLSGELEDAKNILDYVKNLKFVDKEKIGVVGFSMGGAVASILAGIRGEDIRSLCLWSPAGNMPDIVINDFIGEGHSDFIKNNYHEYDGLAFGKTFVDDLKNIDIYGKASEYSGRILLLHGDADEIVSISASERYLDYYGNKADLISINGANHMFNKQIWKQQIIQHSAEFFTREFQS